MEISVADVKIPPRVREDVNVEGLVESMGRIGQLQPILITKENYIIDGLRRLCSAKELRWKKIEAIYADFTNIVERRLAELEANLKRTDFHWADAIKGRAEFHVMCLIQHRGIAEWANEQLAKGKTLLDIYFKITKRGRPNTDEWGLRDTAELLNYHASHLSEDIKMARTLQKNPDLREKRSREALLKTVKQKPMRMTKKQLLRKSLVTLMNKYGKEMFFTAIQDLREEVKHDVI